MFQPGSLLAPPPGFYLERLRRPALEAPNPHAEGSRLWILLEESKAELTPLNEDCPYVPLSVYQASDIVANSTGRALLARAVETNRRDVVQFLLSRGVDVNHESMGLLHSAVWKGQFIATGLLLDCGADVDALDPDRGRTPLMRAADRTRSVSAEVMPAHLAMVRLLLSRGADVRAKDRMGHQAHQIAAMGTPVRALLSDVRAAGGWRSYVHRDRMRLLVLRALCEKGRASTTDGLFARLFPSDGATPASDEETADAAAPPRLDQDVFKKIFSFWEPLGHGMWLDLASDSVHLDRFCRASTICKRMLIPHVEYD